MKKHTPPKETTMRIQVEIRNKVKAFTREKGLKMAPAITRALERTLKDKPEFFMP